MQLAELIKTLNPRKVTGNLQQYITGLAQDSRRVQAGNLFFCVKGVKYDGHQFLKEAAAQGGTAAIVSEPPAEDYGLTIIQVDKVSPELIKEVAGAFYGYPDQKLQLIGVIGTNGKTTSTYLVKSILEAAGHSVGLIGTITNMIKDQPLPTHNTTPGVLELQQLFAAMVQAGVEYVVMEVSSHSIDQGRVAGLAFRCGIFTNITQDHLDYHKTFAEYLRVKSKFFLDLPVTSWAVINGDDPHSDTFIEKTAAKVVTYGVEHPVQIGATGIQLSPTGVSFTANTPVGPIDLRLHLTGYFNVYNSLGALGAGLVLGVDPAAIKQGLESVSGVPGRFQVVPGVTDFGVIVDYAHTPDGLENILNTGRALTKKRLLLVFGCGGDRDRTKRPIMGALAAKLADFSIITSDNPRSEKPEAIIAEIEAGFKEANPKAAYQLEPDRAAAIRKIINLAQPGDLVIIAGKGHENYQIFSDRTIHFDDREVVQSVLEELRHG